MRNTACGTLVLILLQACTVDPIPEGEFTVTVTSNAPPEPDEISATDHQAWGGIVRIEKIILSGDQPFCGKKRSIDPENPPSRPAWDLSFLLEGSGTHSQAEVKDTNGFLMVQDVKIGPPARLDLDWDVRDVCADAKFRHDIGSAFDFTIGLGYGHAMLDITYRLDDGRVLQEHQTLNGLDLRFGVGLHATSWLEFGLGADFLIESKLLLTLDATVVVRPWPVVGVLAGWRFWYFQDNDHPGSVLYLQSSGPLVGLEVRF